MPYYAAAYSLYLLEYLFRNQKIDSSYKVARFQILLALRLIGNPDNLPQLNSRHVETYSKKVCDQLWDVEKADKLFSAAIAAVDAVAGADFDRDKIHTLTFTDALIARCKTLPPLT
jgi:hypothetical protein